MKKKIKIKVKHLIFIPVIIFILIPNMLYMVGKFMVSNNTYIERTGRELKEYSYGIFDLYTKYPKFLSPFEGEAYLEMSKLVYDTKSLDVVSSYDDNRTTIFNKIHTKENVEKAIEISKKGLDSNDDTAFGENAINLLKLYIDYGNVDKGKELIEGFLRSDKFNIKVVGEIGSLYLMYLERDIDGALNYGEELSNKYDMKIFSAFTKGMVQVRDNFSEYDSNFGQYSIGTKERYVKGILKELKVFSEFQFFGTEENAIDKSDWRIRSLEDYDNGKNTVKGRITCEGKPIKLKPVILSGNKYTVYDDYISDSFLTFTDEEGYYEFKNIPDSKDTVGIIAEVPNYVLSYYNNYKEEVLKISGGKEHVVNLELKKNMEFKEPGIKNLEGDKYTIEFSEVKDAKEYNVKLNYNIDYGKKKLDLGSLENEYKGIKDNKLVIELKDGSLIGQELIKSYSEINKGEEYYENVGLIKGGEVYVYVEAIDKNGNIINSTGRNLFSNREKGLILKGKEKDINEGEKLFIDRNFDLGIKWFNDKIKEEGIKREYIYPLIYVSINEEGKIQKSDTKKLIEELYKINKNYDEYNYFMNRITGEK